MERWQRIEEFPDYSVSDHGQVRSDKTGRILSLSKNQYGLVHVGLMNEGVQYHRSLPLLVATAFLPRGPEPFDTPINLDLDRLNNRVDNLAWRPRWFAIKYNQQLKHPFHSPIVNPLVDLKTGEVSNDSTECARRYGLLEDELVFAVVNRTYVWPTYQEFGFFQADA